MKKEELRLQKSSVVSAKNHLKLIKVISEINIFKPYFSARRGGMRQEGYDDN